MQNSIIWAKIVWFFNDLIFMHVLGWCVRPLLNFVSTRTLPILADILLFIIETVFYALVVILLVKLGDFLLSKRRMSRNRRLNKNLARVERNAAIRERKKNARKSTNKKSANKKSTNKKLADPKLTDKKSTDKTTKTNYDDDGYREYKDYDDDVDY